MNEKEFAKLILDTFNQTLEANQTDIATLKKVWTDNHSYCRDRGDFDKLLNQSKVSSLVDKIAKHVGEYPSTEREQATFIGQSLFYLYKLYLTASCMLLMYADRLFEKYDFPYEFLFASELDLAQCDHYNTLPSVTLKIYNPSEVYDVDIIFKDADLKSLLMPVNDFRTEYFEQINYAAYKAEVELTNARGHNNKADLKDDVAIYELGRWLNKVTHILKEITEINY